MKIKMKRKKCETHTNVTLSGVYRGEGEERILTFSCMDCGENVELKKSWLDEVLSDGEKYVSQ